MRYGRGIVGHADGALLAWFDGCLCKFGYGTAAGRLYFGYDNGLSAYVFEFKLIGNGFALRDLPEVMCLVVKFKLGIALGLECTQAHKGDVDKAEYH